MSRFLDEHVRPRAGERLLDIGCGTGDLSRLVPELEYVGVDHNPSYVNDGPVSAGHDRPRFVHADLAALSSLEIGTFDVAVAIGVVHHLDDELAERVVRAVHDKLRDGGRFVCIDPAFHPEQRSVARVLMALDRGRFVRHPGDYERIVSSAFTRTERTVRHDLNPFPYTHCVVEASR